ncbi:MAG: DNA polymerase III subunit gamma/tau [Zoogloeaceae bacterium]|jgi:DNA polymerase-3 subunit gamma/tau|nr:DNA polymerase III subunit gamma/tau [Zoogloeaceae bacterium]
MSYQVLARKWRPRNFSTLAGQGHVVRALTHALNEKRLHHAYLFTGTRGIGKTTIARILAKSLNCEAGVSAEPCGHCSACQEIDAGRFVDLLEVDAATNTRVDEMRQLLENAVYAPTRGRYKVYVIDEVHMLSTSAFNAMLKTLEEPPEHVKFILATTDPQKIPVTVLSRCLQFNLKQMPADAIVERLTCILGSEEIPFEAEALRHIARAAAGSMRDALSLLDQAIVHGAGRVAAEEVRDMLGTVDATRLLDILDALADTDGGRLHAIAEEMRARSLSAASALQELAALLTRIQLLQLVPRLAGDDARADARLRALAGRFSPEFVQLAYQIVTQGRQELALAPDEYSGFLMTLLRLLAFYPEDAAGLAPPSAPEPSREVPRRTSAPLPPPEVPASPAVPAPAGVSQSPPEQSPPGDWQGLVASLKITGMVRQLACNCDLVRVDGTAYVLHLPPEERHLLGNNGNREKLRQALSERLGTDIQLTIEVATVANATPAQIEAAQKRERQAAAMAAIESDPFVRTAREALDASIVAHSIKPIPE